MSLRRLLPLLLLVVLLGAAAADAASRAHPVHGTIRRLCRDTVMRAWPGGPVLGHLDRGADVRRFDFRGSTALGVTNGRRPALRGYVALDAFCAPSARGRAALVRAAELAAKAGRGQPATPLAHPVMRRVCASEVYLRDRPLNRAIGLLFLGDAVRTDRFARNPWRGGAALGHANRRGFVPESALCQGISTRRSGSRVVAAGALRLLAPAAPISCARRIDGRRLVQVGVRIPHGTAGDRLVVDARLERDGRAVGITAARFAGERGRMTYAATGPLACGREQALVYTVRRAGNVVATRRYAVTVGPSTLASAASVRTISRAASVPAACSTPPGRPFAHGGTGPVEHRFHVRPALSAGGRYVAFDSPGRLVAADLDDARDVYRRDLRSGAVTLVSRGGSGGKSRAPAISADGSVVAFESDTAGLVPGDHDHVRDVFVANLATGAITRVGTGGRTPALSADGTLVAYERADPEATVVARVGGPVVRTIAGAFRPALSGNGAFVAYETRTPTGAHDANGSWDIARAPVAGGAPVLVSVGRDGRTQRGIALSASLDADGGRVAFQSDAPGLVRGDRNGLRDVFVRDLAAGTTTRVSVDRCGGDPDGYSRYPSLSADGRRVAFDSHASDLVRGDTGGRGHVYLATVGQHPRLLDTRPGGAPSDRTAFSPGLSADGTTIAFPTFGYDLGVRDANHRVDVYTRRLTTRPRRAG